MVHLSRRCRLRLTGYLRVSEFKPRFDRARLLEYDSRDIGRPEGAELFPNPKLLLV
jgi:hypothetical protein